MNEKNYPPIGWEIVSLDYESKTILCQSKNGQRMRFSFVSALSTDMSDEEWVNALEEGIKRHEEFKSLIEDAYGISEMKQTIARLTLTEDERKALQTCIIDDEIMELQSRANILKRLLERTE